MDYRAFVRTIVLSLVTRADAVEVTSSTDKSGVIRVLITVADEDTGRVIGRRGATINAIRQLARVASVKGGDVVEVDLAEASSARAPRADND